MLQKQKIIVAVTGASGSIYAENLLNKFVKRIKKIDEVALILSENGKSVWEYELENKNYNNYNCKLYDVNNFYAPVASGSSNYNTMIIIPCSMGTLGRIANGTSDNLIIRAADVMLKEKRKLILVTREAPVNLIHIKNMETITLAGGIIMPANPTFYNKPKKIDDLIDTVTNRVLELTGFDSGMKRWGG